MFSQLYLRTFNHFQASSHLLSSPFLSSLLLSVGVPRNILLDNTNFKRTSHIWLQKTKEFYIHLRGVLNTSSNYTKLPYSNNSPTSLDTFSYLHPSDPKTLYHPYSGMMTWLSSWLRKWRYSRELHSAPTSISALLPACFTQPSLPDTVPVKTSPHHLPLDASPLTT